MACDNVCSRATFAIASGVTLPRVAIALITAEAGLLSSIVICFMRTEAREIGCVARVIFPLKN
jgi:hypothetical protein